MVGIPIQRTEYAQGPGVQIQPTRYGSFRQLQQPPHPPMSTVTPGMLPASAPHLQNVQAHGFDVPGSLITAARDYLWYKYQPERTAKEVVKAEHAEHEADVTGAEETISRVAAWKEAQAKGEQGTFDFPEHPLVPESHLPSGPESSPYDEYDESFARRMAGGQSVTRALVGVALENRGKLARQAGRAVGRQAVRGWQTVQNRRNRGEVFNTEVPPHPFGEIPPSPAEGRPGVAPPSRQARRSKPPKPEQPELPW